jgi:hypothetical protein
LLCTLLHFCMAQEAFWNLIVSATAGRIGPHAARDSQVHQKASAATTRAIKMLLR